MSLNLNELVITVIIPILQIAFPVALIFAIVERIVNATLSFIRGDRNVKL